ncbi:hypothetical protein K439DRAFT_1626609, partial [Ramaria rubella]
PPPDQWLSNNGSHRPATGFQLDRRDSGTQTDFTWIPGHSASQSRWASIQPVPSCQ